ncbi:MAG: Stk1 family PASTA domain-containing Ser/Thr kinase [Candidatus Improbicoccus devescovinae]|nr:MAG: Stk1 family PASTA domain-containing Ser/Thr kinase [Candidatus Improbicoccus devescovinae]
MDEYIGKRLDARYGIHELIGIGGMATVYKAFDFIEKEIVAIKILKKEYLDNTEFVRRFRTESKAVTVLSHPNVVKILDVSFGEKIQYIVMEYINGINLKEYIKIKQEIEDSSVISIIKQILLGLKHAHDQGLVHRDIKPQNIMLLRDGSVKIADFGIAKFFRNETQTLTEKSLGSIHYVSPEQAQGMPVDVRTDIYSVGVVFYELLTHRLPFEAASPVSVALMKVQMDPQKPSKINPEIPETLEGIVLTAMEKDVKLRYQKVESMFKDIQNFERGFEINFSNINKNIIGEEEKIVKNKQIIEGKKKRALMISSGIIITVVLFCLAFMFMTMFTPYGLSSARDVDIPDFVGMHLSDLENENYKFHWKIDSVYDSGKPQGVILAQDPVAGSKKIKSGSTIVLKVNSSGVLVEVPVLGGLTQETALAKLNNIKLKYEVKTVYDELIPAGLVIHSDPVQGTKIMIDSNVVVYVSKGPEPKLVIMPDIIGKSLAEAKELIVSAGLKFSGDIIYEGSDYAKDTVISSEPVAGVEIEQNTAVRVVASSGIPKEKNVEINVPFGKFAELGADIYVDIYLDGTYTSSERIDPTVVNYKIYQFRGSQGEKDVTIKINSMLYKRYKINFDEGRAFEVNLQS